MKNNGKKSGVFTAFIVILVMVLVVGGVMAVLTKGFKNFNPFGWFDKEVEVTPPVVEIPNKDFVFKFEKISLIDFSPNSKEMKVMPSFDIKENEVADINLGQFGPLEFYKNEDLSLSKFDITQIYSLIDYDIANMPYDWDNVTFSIKARASEDLYNKVATTRIGNDEFFKNVDCKKWVDVTPSGFYDSSQHRYTPNFVKYCNYEFNPFMLSTKAFDCLDFYEVIGASSPTLRANDYYDILFPIYELTATDLEYKLVFEFKEGGSVDSKTLQTIETLFSINLSFHE